MKRIFAGLAIASGLSFGGAAQADVTITSPTRGVVVKTCSHDAAAICSVRWSNKEFIDDFDHGRQMQSAASFDGLGEAYNPTEAGAGYPYNGLNPSPSSSTLFAESTNASPPAIQTWSRMAYWHPVNGAAVSNWFHHKTVTAYEGLYATYLKYDVQFLAMLGFGEPAHTLGQFESLTGYMPPEFNQFYTLDVRGSRALAGISYCVPPYADCSPEQPLPLIFSTFGGTHAMGIYNRNLPQPQYPAAGFGRWNFAATTPDKVVKWNAVFRLPNTTQGGNYTFTNYVIIGSLNNVKLQMQWLYDNGY